ncbi:MAG: 50S ribosomal protein L3 [Syntrophorhabdaceae bacterium]|nr:50S ribosomal protein L3 [Syntrophorhabdaceae bacterium]
MGIGLLGKKLGMTQIFNEDGTIVPVTVIKVGPCKVTQKKNVEKDGYNAIQVGFDEITKVKNVNKPLKGHFDKAGTSPMAFVKEFRVTDEEMEQYETGNEIPMELFNIGDFVDVTGTSKGKGFAGVVKRHGFKGAPASHGTHEYFRHGGSIGQNMTPGRTFKGMKMPGHMGNKRVTVQNLKVVDIRGDMNILMVEGAVPGPTNGYLIIKKAVKKLGK